MSIVEETKELTAERVDDNMSMSLNNSSNEINISLPYKFVPRDYQEEFMSAIDNGYKRLISVWHRRAGKDKTYFNIVVKEAFKRVGTYFYFLPTYSQGKKAIWDSIDKDGIKMLDHIPAELIKNKNETEMQIEFVNGSILQIVGADNIDRIVGTNPVGVIFSEYSLMKKDVWDMLRPILAENGGWAMFNFTPRGMNHAYALMQMAKNSPDKWFVSICPVSQTKAIDIADLESEKKEMTRALYEQEFECKFLDNDLQFFSNIENCIYPESMNLPIDGNFKLGVDLARKNDYTVITPFNLKTFLVYPQDSFNQIDWVLQEAKIEANARKYNNARITIDSTGVGDPVVQDLISRGLNIQEEDVYIFSANSRRNLLNNLAISLEQRKILIPNDRELIDQLKSFTIDVDRDTGKQTIKAPEHLHDDKVMSLALAIWNVEEKEVDNIFMDYNVMEKRMKHGNEWI